MVPGVIVYAGFKFINEIIQLTILYNGVVIGYKLETVETPVQ